MVLKEPACICENLFLILWFNTTLGLRMKVNGDKDLRISRIYKDTRLMFSTVSLGSDF